MSTTLTRYASRVAAAREMFPKLNNDAWSFVQDADDAVGIKSAIRLLVVRELAIVYAETAKFINGFKNPNGEGPLCSGQDFDYNGVTIGGLTRVASVESLLNDLRYVEGALMSPFVYDSRDTYRWTAINNLIHATEVLKHTIDRLQNPSQF